MKNPRIEAQCRLDTPLGPLTLAATAQGLAGAWFDGQKHHPGEIAAPVDPAHPQLAAAVAALTAYFEHGRLPPLPLDTEGTAFQRSVWQALAAVAPGTVTSYGELARRVGRPLAVRAVGAAVGRNPVSIVVPCHRVLGSAGALTGYAGGLERKQALLALERERAAAAAGRPA
jgi:methylated-DNA-[protein]-cysteine S-methyltransferase